MRRVLSPLHWWRALKREWMLYHLAIDRFRFLYEPPPPDEWVSVDCETTGLNVHRDEIISIGAVRIVGNRIMTSQRLELIVKPSRGVSAESIRVHGLRELDVTHGLDPDEAIKQLLDFIGSRPLVGYYLEFDVAMINRIMWPLLGVKLPQDKIEVSGLYYDHKFRKLPSHLQGNPHIDLRFATMMKDLDLPTRPAHAALNDAVMAAMAFVKLRDMA
jgi:DNA polymerase-3 subunit epsilon